MGFGFSPASTKRISLGITRIPLDTVAIVRMSICGDLALSVRICTFPRVTPGNKGGTVLIVMRWELLSLFSCVAVNCATVDTMFVMRNTKLV